MLAKCVFLMFLQKVLSGLTQKPIYDVDNHEVMGRHFEEFLKTYKRQYSDEEKHLKFDIFLENVKEINRLNKKYNNTSFGINNFADMSDVERRSYLGLASPTGNGDPNGDCTLVNAQTTSDSPPALDWRDKNVVSPVKDQSNCGSCWAFSATALVESRSMENGQQLVLSEQQLVDCDKQSQGCSGGFPSSALTLLMQEGGQMSESDYPYESTDANGCRFDKSKVAGKVASCSVYSLQDGEKTLQDLLSKEGPLSICVYAASWSAYTGGVFSDCDGNELDHAVFLVGYGSENAEDYWIIKNSWGESWGELGFIRIKKGVGCCRITVDNEPYATVSAVIS